MVDVYIDRALVALALFIVISTIGAPERIQWAPLPALAFTLALSFTQWPLCSP